MEFLGIEKFGTVKTNGVIRAIPTRPWHTGSCPGILSDRGKGDIYTLPEGSTLFLGNSSTNGSNIIPWVHLKEGNKHIYISTKVLLTNITWDYLNERNMIYGTPVTIDGKEYKLRVLTGGEQVNQNNEWDNIICNTANITGLPKPTTEDLTSLNTYGQLDGTHNQLWNWWGVYTICQEKYSAVSNVVRGYESTQRFTWYNLDSKSPYTGWRPVLEYTDPTSPPEKPTIIKPKGIQEKPEVVDEDPIMVETKFNNPGGEFKWMDIEVFDIDQGINIVQNSTVASTTYNIRGGKIKGHRYRMRIRHQNTSGQYSPYAESFFIYGQLNKYKLSEPVTQKQYDKLTAYTGGENLIMKPQQFPETENSKIRLVPQTMNTITAGETTTKELEYSASTKQPTIGDRLIKDKETYSISEVVKENPEIHVEAEVESHTDTLINFREGTGRKSYVYNGNIYFAYQKDDKLNLKRASLDGSDVYLRVNTTKPQLQSISITGNKNMVYTVYTELKQLNIHVLNADTNVGTAYVFDTDDNQIYSVSATIDSYSNYLVVATKEYLGGTDNYGLVCYWYDISNPNEVKQVKRQIINNQIPYLQFGTPIVEDIPDETDGTTYIYYTLESPNTNELIVIERKYQGTEPVSSSKLIQFTGMSARNSTLCVRGVPDTDGKILRVVSISYTESEGNYKIRLLIMKQGSSMTGHIPVISKDNITTQQITHDKEHGIILVYATTDGLIRQMNTIGYNHTWSEPTTVKVITNRGYAQVFETIDYNPYQYGKHPGLLVLEYNETAKADKMMLRSDYSMEEPKPNKLILDKPITTQAGETIKFLDYDLEVSSGETKAKITPTNITNDYYEYDAKFDKKEAERKVTVVGRNSKLTTLYYYNY